MASSIQASVMLRLPSSPIGCVERASVAPRPVCPLHSKPFRAGTAGASPLLPALGARQPSQRLCSTAQAANSSDAAGTAPEQAPEASTAPRDDDVLPDSLTDALLQAGEATALAIQRNASRCVVEILLAEFWDPVSGAVFAEEGDQMRWWKLSKRFVEDLQEATGGKRVKVVYPDMGCAAMLRNQWPDANFSFASLTDRKPVAPEDEVVVLAAPDPQGLDDVIRIADEQMAEGQTLVLFNPRLASGDVGIGLSVRRMRDRFLSTFVTTYSLRPIGDEGSVFRKYPDLWKVFVSDLESPGRYKLAAERGGRPAGDVLELILLEAMGGANEGGDGKGPGLLAGLGQTVASFQRFMRSLS